MADKNEKYDIPLSFITLELKEVSNMIVNLQREEPTSKVHLFGTNIQTKIHSIETMIELLKKELLKK